LSEYLRPRNIDEALSYLAATGATVAAGCTDLFPATDNREITGPVLDITGLSDLRKIDVEENSIRIGAASTWTDVIRADLPPAFDMLKEAAREVGSVQIQNSGTVVGNICNASPAADGIPCLLALDADVNIAGPNGPRRVPLSSFIQGVRQIDLNPGELVTGLVISQASARGNSKFKKLGARRYLVVSIAMVAVRLVAKNGVVDDIAISVGACNAVSKRMHVLEADLVGAPMDSNLAELVSHTKVASELSPIDDIRADAAYRVDAAVELVCRTVSDLARGLS